MNNRYCVENSLKKLFIALALSALPMMANADISVGISIAPGVVIHIGDRDDRGHYWDGREWRDREWWEEHGHGHLVRFGDYDDRGYRWDGDRWRDRAWWEENESRGRAEEHWRQMDHEREHGHNYYSDEGRRGEYQEDEHRDHEHGHGNDRHGDRD